MKTAKVVLNVGFGHPYVAVDTHIFRVATRLGLGKEPTPDKMSVRLEAIIPKKYLKNAHHYLLLHGRYCCKAQAPNCAGCSLASLCPSRSS